MIPRDCTMSYQEIISNYVDWLQSEAEKDREKGYEWDIHYPTPKKSSHYGKFGDELLLKIRARPEVAFVECLGIPELTEDEFLCWEPSV